MTEHIILVCVLACIVCPVLALASIIFSNHTTNRHIRSTEAQFLKIYRRSEERIDRKTKWCANCLLVLIKQKTCL